MTVLDYLEILARFAHERFGAEMVKAREKYFRDLGVIHESDELYEEVMKAYLDWFLFERPVEAEGMSLIRLYIQQAAEGPESGDVEIYKGFAYSGRRSLFLIKKILPDAIECRDLFTKEKMKIREDVPEGFFKGEIFEARVLPMGEELRFGDFLRFHPPRANRVIEKAAKPIKDCADSAAKDLMTRLALCKVKHFRFPRIDLLQFYEEALR